MTNQRREDNSTRITRRGLVGGAAAGAAGLALSDRADAQRGRAGHRIRRGRDVDVVVVGAGLAGLTAARELVRAGRSVVVLEARNRAGGRTLNRSVGGGKVVEIGGQWVGPGQDRVLKLIKELGLKTFKTYNEGRNVFYANGRRQTYRGTIPPVNAATLAELALALENLNAMAGEVPTDAPWRAEKSGLWDGQTVETWKRANFQTEAGRDLLDLAVQAVWATEPRDISLLHVLFYIAAAGGDINTLFNTAGGAQESRVVGGSQLISIHLARDLGGRVKLRSPVREIRFDSRGADVHTRRRVRRGRRVIVTLPPALAGRIRYRPSLPGYRDQLTQRMPMGTVFKCVAVYDEPFWRDDGLTGQATSDTGPAKITFDNSPPDGSPGIMLGFIEGQEAREQGLRSAAERRRSVLESFSRYFGQRALRPREYFDISWAEEPYTRGCYVGFTPPGVLTGYGPAIRDPVGPIHWAGTETATIWNGYMDGAIQSGRRAAKEVLASL